MTLQERNGYIKYPYSAASLEKLSGVHPGLVDFAFILADIIDCKIVYGVRSDEEQHQLFLDGKSEKDGYANKSNHQKKADGYGHAIDILPLPNGVNMYLDDGKEDDVRWAQFDGCCQTIAYFMGIKIRTGFKWRSGLMASLERPQRDNKLPDGNHVELV